MLQYHFTLTVNIMSLSIISEYRTSIIANLQNCFTDMEIISAFTLRGLSLFFKILPLSNTGVSAAYILATVHFLYPKPVSFSNMEYYFYQLAYRDSKIPTRCLSYPPDCMGGVIEHHNLHWRQREGCAPFKPPLTGDTPL